jgi:hypothetical protein
VTVGRKFCCLSNFPRTGLISIEIPPVILKIQNKVNLKGNWSHINSWNSIVHFRNWYLFCSKENVLVHAQKKYIFLHCFVALICCLSWGRNINNIVFWKQLQRSFFEPKQDDVGRRLKKLFIELRWYIVKGFWMKVVVVGWESGFDVRSRTYIPNFYWGSLNVTFLKTKQGNLAG